MRSPRRRAALAYRRLPHVAAEEKRRFLIHERDTAHGVPGRKRLKQEHRLEQRGDAAGVVVGPRTAGHRVVMRAQYDDFVRLNAAWQRRLDVRALDASHQIVLALHRAATHRPLPFDIVGSRVQRSRAEHVALADVSGKDVHMAFQRRSQVGHARSLHTTSPAHVVIDSQRDRWQPGGSVRVDAGDARIPARPPCRRSMVSA
jgi:hypothetical protein